ncbi:MAG: DUF2085 domain-containing protein [Candidatus Brocadiia bacterium]
MPTLDSLLYTFCHHRPDRLLQALGGSSLLCARCSGIYMGFALGFVALFFAFRRRSGDVSARGLWLPVLLCLLLPMEVAGERFLGLDPGNYGRFLSGLCLGSGFSAIIVTFWGAFFPEANGGFPIRTDMKTLAASTAFAVVGGLLAVVLLYVPLAFNVLVMLSLAGAYVIVNALLARGLFGVRSVLLCFALGSVLTILEWTGLFFLNNTVLAKRF